MTDNSDFASVLLGIALGPVLFFLIGSIPSGYLVCRCRDIDLRQHGSGNIGATNVGRVLGKKWAALVFVLDFLKGFLPVLFSSLPNESGKTPAHLDHIYRPLCMVLFNLFQCHGSYVWFTMILGIFLVMGHDYSPWLGFKGGKGIAASAGVLAALAPIVLVIALTFWLIVLGLTCIVSLASIAACISLPVAAAIFYRGHKETSS